MNRKIADRRTTVKVAFHGVKNRILIAIAA
jgi:hypothetical protein